MMDSGKVTVQSNQISLLLSQVCFCPIYPTVPYVIIRQSIGWYRSKFDRTYDKHNATADTFIQNVTNRSSQPYVNLIVEDKQLTKLHKSLNILVLLDCTIKSRPGIFHFH